MKQKAKRILVVMLTVMIIFGYLAPLVADEANAATADLDLCDLGCELEHCDGDHCDGGHYDEENCDWGHCDEEICDGVICDGDNCDGGCYSEHCGDCECENGHCDEQCDSIGVVEVASSSSVGRMTKEQAACSHVWNVSAATCTVQKWCKKCGYVAQKALGHSTVYKETKAATCTTQGTYVYKCTRSGCGYSTGGYIPSLGHKAGAAATCTSPQKCTRCGVTLKDKLGHSAGAAATCTTAQKCTRCGVTLKNKLGHSAGAAATCTTAQKCTRCGVTLKNALGHDAPYKETKAPTCTTQGEYVYKCTRCSYSTGGYIPALGHVAGAAATCTTAQKCTRCNATLCNALGHAWDSGTVTKAATCTATGTKTFKCSRCGGTKTETINALGHSAGAAATCTTPQKCTRCSATLKNALGHAWDNGTVTKAATCTATGTKVYKCTRSGCSATTSETIPMIAHNCEWRVTVQPSCKGSGTEQYTCKVCGTGTAWRSIQYYGDHTWVAATCTKAKTCSVCGATSGDPLGHAYSWRTTVNPTCTTVGKKEQYCTRPGCTSVVNRQDVAALNHAWDNGTVTKGASHSSTGVKTFKCTRNGCTATKTETIPVIAHSYTWVVTTPSTCTKEGVESYKCSCGDVSQTRSVAKKAHNGAWALTVQPSCAGSGTEECTCKDCGAWLGARSVQYYGDHTWVAATCSTPKTCSVCGATSGSKLDHTYAWRTTDEPSCTKVGYRERFCTGCGEIVRRQEIPANGHTWDIDVTEVTCERGQKCTTCGATGESPKAHDYELQTYSDADDANVVRYTCKECKTVFSEKRFKVLGGSSYNFIQSLVSVSSGLLPDAIGFILDSLEIPDGYELVAVSLDPEAKDVTDVPETAIILPFGSEAFTFYAVLNPIIRKESQLTFYYDASGMLWEKREKKDGKTVRWEREDVSSVKNGTVELTISNNNPTYSISDLPEWFHVTKEKKLSDGIKLYFDCAPCYDIMDEGETRKKREAEITIISSEGEKVCLRIVQYRPIDFGGSGMLSRKQHESEYAQYERTTSNRCVSFRSFFNLDGKDRKVALADNRKDVYIFHREYKFSPIQSESSIGGHYLTTLSNYDKLYLSIDVSYSRFSLHEDNSSDGVVKQKEFYFTEELRHGLGGATRVKMSFADEDLSTALLTDYVRYSTGGFYQSSDDFWDNISSCYRVAKDVAGIVIDVWSLVDGNNKVVKTFAVVLSGVEFVETLSDGEWGIEDLGSAGSLVLSIIDLTTSDFPTPVKVVMAGVTIADIISRGYDLVMFGIENIDNYADGLAETQTCKISRKVDNNIVFESIDESRINLSDGLNAYVAYYDTPSSSHIWHAKYEITAYGETYTLEWVNGEPIIH